MRTDARRNRQRLLEAAHHSFRANGVTASMDEIARRAGVGIGTLYRHFPSRDSLVLALVADDLERVATLADELLSSDQPNAVARWLAELVRHDLTYRGLAESTTAATGSPTPLGAACERLHAAGAALIQHHQRHGTIRADIEPADAIALANAIAWITESDTDERRRDGLFVVVLDGIRPVT